MNILKGLVLVLLLTGCGNYDTGSLNGEPEDNYGYGFYYSEISDDGLRYRADGSYTTSAAHLSQIYTQVEACTGIRAPGPLVISVDEINTGTGSLEAVSVPRTSGKTRGLYIERTQTILVYYDGADGNLANFASHEFIHYLLDASTGDLDPGHGHALWSCVIQ